jgi:predicted Zn-ribbon and HTH transcriptional regulator
MKSHSQKWSKNVDPAQSGVEVADIFREYMPAYLAEHKLPLHYYRVINAIQSCRTSVLGGHIDACKLCGFERHSYNSCGNRHCPKCRALAREQWLLDRKDELLPVTYYHAVFTLPDLLNPLALVNERVIYNILFQSAWETISKLCHDPKHLGALSGLIAILHTWGQTLIDHPHLHCIIPGGGLSEDQKKWTYPKKSKKKKKFFIHVNIISDLYKKIFLSYLKAAYKDGELKFSGQIAYLNDSDEFRAFINKLYTLRWVTYCKRPFGGPEQVLEYLGRYTHRVAISNNRLIKVENGRVYFKYRDYRDGGQIKVMPLEVFEFIRRFLLHILPCGFPKIRYYGLLCSRMKNILLRICRLILGAGLMNEGLKIVKRTWQELYFELTGTDPMLCPNCGQGRMITISIFPRIYAAGFGPP